MPSGYPFSSGSGLNANPAPAVGALPNVYNFNPSLLKKWRAARGKVRAGTANARILCIGDSTTYGNGSNGSNTGNLIPLSWPTQLATLINASGLNAHWNSIIGCSNNASPPSRLATDSRLTKSGSATYLTGGYTTAGGDIFLMSSTGSFSFLPTVNVDTFNWWYAVASGNGVCNLNINGGSNTAVNTYGASTGTGMQTMTGTLGSNTLNMVYSTNNVSWLGVEAYDSSKKWVSVMNAGWCAATSVMWNASPYAWSPVPMIATYAPALTIINLTINDADFGTSLATYQANMQALITAAVNAGSDVVLATGNPVNPSGNASMATVQQYINVCYALAASNNIPLIDVWGRWQSYAVSNPLGLMYDSLHPNGAGYADIASAVAGILITV